MTRAQQTAVDRWQLAIRCPTCHAAVDAWCVTPTGRFATYLHTARYWAAKEA